MRNDPVKKPWEWSAQRTAIGVTITIEREIISFVKEVIPDGQMAGMMGHREVPSTESVTFDLHPDQALVLWEELGRALGRVIS